MIARENGSRFMEMITQNFHKIYCHPAILVINIKRKIQHTFTTDKYESVRPTYFPTIAILTCKFQSVFMLMNNYNIINSEKALQTNIIY